MKKLLNLTLAAVVAVSCLSGLTSFAAEGDTYLDKKACTAGPAVVETPFDVNFGTFSSNEVYGTTLAKKGEIVQGSGSLHTAAGFGTALPWLVVSDACGSGSRHADLLGSDMIDMNVSNTVTANPIPASNMYIAYLSNHSNLYGGYSDVAFLDNTPIIADVSLNAGGGTLDGAVQVLTRTEGDDKDIAGLFGARPEFNLTIPSYQQPDRYEGTITWTVIMQ